MILDKKRCGESFWEGLGTTKPQRGTQSCAAHGVEASVGCQCSQDAKILKYPDLEGRETAWLSLCPGGRWTLPSGCRSAHLDFGKRDKPGSSACPVLPAQPHCATNASTGWEGELSQWLHLSHHFGKHLEHLGISRRWHREKEPASGKGCSQVQPLQTVGAPTSLPLLLF